MVNLGNYEEYILLEADGELNETERRALYAFLELHPDLKKELELYKAAHLAPDVTMVYEDKQALIKTRNTQIIPFNRRWMYAAAAVLLIFLSVGLFRNADTEPEQTIADIKQNTEVPITETPESTIIDTGKTIHSTPADPIVYEKKEKTRTVIAAKPKTIEKQVKEHIAKTEPKKNIPVTEQPIAQPEEIKPKELPKEIIAVETEEKTVIEPGNTLPESKKPSTWSSIKDERMVGLNDFSATVNDRVEQVRILKNKLKDSDITFKLGKKELFVVRL